MRKKHPEHVNLERWLVSYADFITLLFAFFVIMYAMSQADMAKFKKVTDSMHKVFSNGPAAGMMTLGGNSGANSLNSFESVENPGGRAVDLPAGKINTATDPDPQLQEVRELLEETVSLELGATEVSNQLHMHFDSRGLIVRVAVKDFFDEGSVEVRPDLRPILDRLGRVLSKTKRLIRLEGHSDVSEEIPSRFAGSWEFSAARAAWIMKYWQQRFDFDSSRMGVAGYSHFRPLSRGTEPWQRAKNRRVEIIILNNQYEAP